MWSPNGGSKETQSWTQEQRQWSAQQSNLCLSVPHESVDWAQLAKQWIQLQSQPQQHSHNSMPPMTAPMPPMQSMPPMRSPLPPQMPPLPPMGGHFVPIAHNLGHRPQHIIPEDTSRPVYQTPIEANNWIRNHRPPPPQQPMHSMQAMPPMTPPMPTPLPQHNYQSSFGSWRPPNVSQIQSPIITAINANEEHKSDKIVTNQLMSLDAAKKKNLPNWLREGLEKMEKEKAKKMEKEKEEHHRIERMKAIRDKEEELRREIELEQKLSSKYESDSDDNDDNQSNGGNKSEEEDIALNEEQMVFLSKVFLILNLGLLRNRC